MKKLLLALTGLAILAAPAITFGAIALSTSSKPENPGVEPEVPNVVKEDISKVIFDAIYVGDEIPFDLIDSVLKKLNKNVTLDIDYYIFGDTKVVGNINIIANDNSKLLSGETAIEVLEVETGDMFTELDTIWDWSKEELVNGLNQRLDSLGDISEDAVEWYYRVFFQEFNGVLASGEKLVHNFATEAVETKFNFLLEWQLFNTVLVEKFNEIIPMDARETVSYTNEFEEPLNLVLPDIMKMVINEHSEPIDDMGSDFTDKTKALIYKIKELTWGRN
ncbi:hypothetical protein [[Acholeplasma] multilocale]|uniref:hypothetical protein n=1 Tax=[Acholeplasma] multilocale TaxID=264638 RepID=UPI00047E3EA5|nr:hypothetical protein [[Acholeplasma] multilocale]